MGRFECIKNNKRCSIQNIFLRNSRKKFQKERKKERKFYLELIQINNNKLITLFKSTSSGSTSLSINSPSKSRRFANCMLHS
jgi:hypothetical protein